MISKLSDQQLANEYRRARANARPLYNELVRRGFSITEAHDHKKVPVTSFENIIISKPTVVKL